VGCGTYRAEEKCKHGLGGETPRKETIWKTEVWMEKITIGLKKRDAMHGLD